MFIVWWQNQYNKLEIHLTNWFVSIIRFYSMSGVSVCLNQFPCYRDNSHLVCLHSCGTCSTDREFRIVDSLLHFKFIFCSGDFQRSHTFTMTVDTRHAFWNYSFTTTYGCMRRKWIICNLWFSIERTWRTNADSAGFFQPHTNSNVFVWEEERRKGK